MRTCFRRASPRTHVQILDLRIPAVYPESLAGTCIRPPASFLLTCSRAHGRLPLPALAPRGARKLGKTGTNALTGGTVVAHAWDQRVMDQLDGIVDAFERPIQH